MIPLPFPGRCNAASGNFRLRHSMGCARPCWRESTVYAAGFHIVAEKFCIAPSGSFGPAPDPDRRLPLVQCGYPWTQSLHRAPSGILEFVTAVRSSGIRFRTAEHSAGSMPAAVYARFICTDWCEYPLRWSREQRGDPSRRWQTLRREGSWLPSPEPCDKCTLQRCSMC